MTEAEDLDRVRRVIALPLATEERRQAAFDALARLEFALTIAQRASAHRLQKLLELIPEQDVCLDCGVHRSKHYPVGPVHLADCACPCEVFMPFGLFDPMDERIRRSLRIAQQAVSVVEPLIAVQAENATLRAALDSAQQEVRSVINRDRTGLAATLNHIQAIVRGWQWIAEGTWGSYTYEEQTTQTLQKEVGELIESVLRAASRGLRQSGDRAIAASRWTLEPLAQAAPAPEKP